MNQPPAVDNGSTDGQQPLTSGWGPSRDVNRMSVTPQPTVALPNAWHGKLGVAGGQAWGRDAWHTTGIRFSLDSSHSHEWCSARNGGE